MRAMFEAHDWSASPLGPPEGWPQSLKTTVGLILPAMAQIVLFWGPEYVALYNDAYAPTIGDKHPRALGRPAEQSWTELWDDLEPMLRSVRETGETVFAKDRPFHIDRHGYDETVWFDISFSAVPDESSGVGGVLCIVSETTERVAADMQVRAGEARFHAMADSIDQMIWSTLPDGYHDYYNRRWYDYTGVPEGSTDGEAWNGMFHPEDQDRAWGVWRRCLETGEPYHIEYRLRHRSGDYRWVLGRAQPVRDESGAIARWYGTCTDIHDLKTAEQAVRESEARFRSMADSAPSPVWVTNASGIEFVNEAFEAMAGRPAAELSGETWVAMIHPDDLPEARRLRAEAWRTGSDYGYDARFRHADGSEHWMKVSCRPRLDEAGVVVGYVGLAVDITEAKEAEIRLRESEERLRIALAAGQLGDWYWDVETDMIDFSAETAALFGIPQGPVISWADMHKLIDPEDAPAAYAAVDEAVRERRDYAIEYRMLRPGGAWIWVSAVGRPIYHADGRPKGVIGVVENISARKRAEAELLELNQSLESRVAAAIADREQAEEALRQSQKMEAVGQLTGGIAHDFNNLLTIITGNVDAARRHVGEEGSPRVVRALGNALVGAERAAVLTQRLLAFSRRQPLNPRPIDPNRLVTGMSELLHRTLGETIAVETVLGAGLWKIDADPHQLENAILNLAVNARDAMPDGGKLTIETANTHIDRDYAAQNPGAMPGQYVAICVSDIGTGMNADALSRAFEPFFTTKEVGKGTGLGLSMVYGFVKQSGGHVKIYSEEGQGTTVRIYLPRLIAEEAEEEEKAVMPVPEGTGEETILVCEDDDDVRAYTVEVLRELGYRVLEAHDGPSAIRLLERQEGRVDLLFTDVVLPSGMTGAMVAQEARRLRPDLRVLFTTGYARNAIVHHGRLDPGVELITKPFAYADLAARVRDMLDRN
jgi:PAS domain S-box-containing protein